MQDKVVNFKFDKSPVMAATNGGGVLNMYVFGEISAWWGVNKNDVLLSLKGKKYSQINLIISSNGGDLAEALVIYDLLKSYPANVTTYLTGLCASAATILAAAGNTIVMSKQCIYMIHKPLFSWTGGNADDLRRDAKLLDQWEELALNVYEPKTGLSRAKLSKLMAAETWMTADEALQLGFVDEVAETLAIDFEVDGMGMKEEEEDDEDPDKFINEPIYFKNSKTVYNQAVKALIQGGYSQNNLAKSEALESKNFNMEKIFKNFVAMLVTAGLIAEDKKEAANEAAAKMETPELLASMVREEVQNALKGAAPSMKIGDVAKLIENATADEKTAIASALGVKAEYDDKAIKDQITELAGKVATLIVGESDKGESNGDSGFEGKKGDAEMTFKQKENYNFYLNVYNEGKIDATTFKAVTGFDVPKKA